MHEVLATSCPCAIIHLCCGYLPLIIIASVVSWNTLFKLFYTIDIHYQGICFVLPYLSYALEWSLQNADFHERHCYFVLPWLVLSLICMLWRDELGISNINLQFYWCFVTEHWYQLPPFETCSSVELLKTPMKTVAATTSFQGVAVLSPKHFYLRRKALFWARVYTVSFQLPPCIILVALCICKALLCCIFLIHQVCK